MDVLQIGALLQTRIVLLKGVAVDGIDQVEREIGIEIEERASEEAIDFECVAVGAGRGVVGGEGGERGAAAGGGIGISEAGESAGIDEVQGGFAGGRGIV